MKKITILLSTSLLLASIISCTKGPVRQPDNSVVDPPPPPPPVEVKIASSWFSVTLDTMIDRSKVYLIGRHEFETNEKYSKLNHIELAYVKIPGQRIAVYKRLPLKYMFPLASANKGYSFDFSMSQTEFILTISNLFVPDDCPDASAFEDFMYRYVVIPKTLFESLSINWNNYSEVALALNI